MPNSSEIYESLIKNFPLGTPRPEQMNAFEHLAPWFERLFIQRFENPLHFGIDAPPGVGKSLLAASSALAIKELYEKEFGSSLDEKGYDNKQIWIVTQTKILQDQYQEDFPDHLFDLRGLDNYSCDHDSGKTCGQSICGRIRKKEDQKGKPPEFCSFSCEYDREKDLAKAAPILSLNAAKAFTLLKNPQQPRPLLMIFDEGHEVESALDNEAAIQLKPEDLHKLGLSFPKFFPDLRDMDSIQEGLSALLDECTPLYKAEEKAPAEFRDIKRFKKLDSIIKKANETLDSIQNYQIEYVSCSNDFLDLRPLQVHKIFEKVFKFPTIFLSATLLSKRGFQGMTGIDDGNLDWFSCASPFPVSNRPIKMGWRIGATPLNYNNMSAEMPNVLARIKSILDKHAEDRGIIHTHTYKNAEIVYNALWPQYGSRLLFPKTAMEQRQALETHAKSKNTVLLSPSMTQGVNLKDDLCRFGILMKVPWLPTNDPIVSARKNANSEWYTYRTAMTVIQAAGRGVRSTTDFSDTYCVDPGFARFFGMAQGHLPAWFKESLNMKPQGFY